MWCLCLLSGPAQAATTLPDPTRPADYLVTPAFVEVEELPGELVDWSVTAIRISSKDRSAIVNGRLVRVGDEIGPARVLEINPVSIVLDYDNKHVNVKLFSDRIKKVTNKQVIK